jgi:single-strand DNA-binding protein
MTATRFSTTAPASVEGQPERNNTMNNVTIIGRLGNDPETRSTPNSKTLTRFSIAVENRFRDNDEPDWIPVEAWGKTADSVSNHKSKGDQVAITGHLTHTHWVAADGTHHNRLVVTADSVEFLHNARHRDEVTT